MNACTFELPEREPLGSSRKPKDADLDAKTPQMEIHDRKVFTWFSCIRNKNNRSMCNQRSIFWAIVIMRILFIYSNKRDSPHQKSYMRSFGSQEIAQGWRHLAPADINSAKSPREGASAAFEGEATRAYQTAAPISAQRRRQ